MKKNPRQFIKFMWGFLVLYIIVCVLHHILGSPFDTISNITGIAYMLFLAAMLIFYGILSIKEQECKGNTTIGIAYLILSTIPVTIVVMMLITTFTGHMFS